jgi:hypothetical protein
MPEGIPESDWKHLSHIRPKALERLCEMILAEVRDISADSSRTCHERYLALYKHIGERDKDIALAFNNPRRSWAIVHISAMRRFGIVTDEEFAGFTEVTQRSVAPPLS